MAARRTKSSEVLQEPRLPPSLEYPVLVRDGHYALSMIQDLQPAQRLLILAPHDFPKKCSDTFQRALLSNYSVPPTVVQLPYGDTQVDPQAEAAMRSAAQTIILVDNVHSDQMTFIERTTNVRPLLIMIGPPSKRYFDFMQNLREKRSPPSSVITLVQGSAQGLKRIADLIRSTAILIKDEESLDALADSMSSYL